MKSVIHATLEMGSASSFETLRAAPEETTVSPIVFGIFAQHQREGSMSLSFAASTTDLG